MPGNGRNLGAAAGGNDQLVVGHVAGLPGGDIFHGNGLFLAVDFHRAGAELYIDVAQVTEEFRSTDDPGGCGAQAFHLFHIAADKIRNAAAAVGNNGALIDEGDVAFGLKTLEAAGGLGAESHTSDDENILGHVGKPRRVINKGRSQHGLNRRASNSAYDNKGRP